MARSEHEFLPRDQLLDLIERRDARIQALEAQVQRLATRVHQLEDLLEESRRNGKRQAGPFAKGPPKPDPKPPGRKAGAAYGRHAHRRPPTTPPDETYDVLLPAGCPDCGGALREEAIAEQHQVEIPRQPIHRLFRLHIGRCRCCGRRVQPRHPLQTSDALGAASTQLGAAAQTAVALLKSQLGLSYDKIRRFFREWAGLVFSHGGYCRTVLRIGQRLAPLYHELIIIVRRSAQVCPDETGWRIGGLRAWLHAFASRVATVYVIRQSRGGDVPRDILGPHYAGALVHDGWRTYDAFPQATHQQCLRHLLNRCKELLELALGRAREFPCQLAALLSDALALRDRRAARGLSPHGLAVARGRLEHRLDDLLDRRPRQTGSRRLANFLRHHRQALFPFLYHPDLEATNWWGEQAIRPSTANRKVFGGNRTPAGAHALEVQLSLFRTGQQHGVKLFGLTSALLRQPPSIIAAVPDLFARLFTGALRAGGK
jgi:transposase